MFKSDTENNVEKKKRKKENENKKHNIINELEPIDIFNQMINIILKKVKSSHKANSSYSNIRIFGINVIKSICKKFNINDKIYFSSINLLDELYIYKQFTEDVQKISFVCLILTIKFLENEDCSIKIVDEIIKNNQITFYSFFESKIIEIMDYDFILYSTYDILSFLLENGIIFSPEKEYLRKYNFDVKKVHLNCFKHLNFLVEKKFFIKFHPIEIAFSIISINREIYGLSDIHILFERIYHFEFDNYTKCLEYIKSKIKFKRVIHPSM